MEVKEIWCNQNYKEMGWHDSRLYSVTFPIDDFKLIFDIDYIFEWVKQEDGSFKFWVSPCTLVFFDVLNIKINIDFEDYVDIYIDSIERVSDGLTDDMTSKEWNFVIHTDRGTISFCSSGYEQRVKLQPILSESQVIGRSS